MSAAPLDFTYWDQVHGPFPFQAIQPVMERSLRAYPTEEESAAAPPGLSNGRVEGFDFESVLGTYDANERKITVWTRGLEAVADLIGLHSELLKRIVRLHEMAHAYHHRGYSPSVVDSLNGIVAQESMHDDIFRVLTTETVEQVAQIATLAALRAQADAATHSGAGRDTQAMLDGFQALMKRQSAPYRLPGTAFEMPLPRLKGKLRLLLEMTDAGMSPSASHVEGILA